MKLTLFFSVLFYSLNSLGIEKPPLWLPGIIELGDTGKISKEYTPGSGLPENSFGVSLFSLSEGPATFGHKSGISHKKDKKIISLSKTKFGVDGKLKSADLGGEYLIYDRKNVEVPIGGNLSFKGGAIGGFLRFIPSGGKEVVRKVRNSSEIEKLPKAKIPFNLKTLRKSLPRLGDKMGFFVQGGVTIGGSSMFGLTMSAKARFLVSGEWEVIILRIGPTRIKATLKKVSILGVKGEAGPLFSKLGAKYIRNKLKHISFEYDLGNETGIKLFKGFMRGKAIDSEEFLKNNPNSTIVKRDNHGVFITKSKGLFAKMSIPSIFAVGSSYSVEDVFSSEYLNKKNKMVEARFGIYKYQSYVSSSLTSRNIERTKKGNVKRTKMFLGQVLGKGTTDNVDYAANIKFQFNGTNYNKRQFNSELKKIIRWTGLEKEFKLEMPEKVKHRYLQVDLDILISNYAIRDLLENFENYKPSKWKGLALDSLTNYFRKDNDYLGICPQNWGTIICKKFVKLRTSQSMDEIYKLLQKMRKNLKKGKMEEFTKHYASFGKNVLYSPFTYRTLIWVMRKYPIQAVLTARGQDIKFHQKIVPLGRLLIGH